VPPPQES
jgi:hypothetical protein